MSPMLCAGVPLAWMVTLQGWHGGTALLQEDASKHRTKNMNGVPGAGCWAQRKGYE